MHKKSKLLSIIIIILLIAVVGLAALIFTSPAFKESQVYKFLSSLFYRGSLQIEVKVLDPNVKGAADYGFSKDAIIVAKEQGVYAMDLKGEWLWDRKVNLKKPVVKSAGSYFVVADLEGQAVLLYKDNKFMWQKDFSQGVINVDLTKDGVVTVVHGEEGYTGAVSVMNVQGDANGNGTVKFTRKINNYIVSAVSSETQVCINGFSTTGGSVSAAINFLRMSDGQSFSSKIADGEMFNFALYLDDSLLVFNSERILKYQVKETGDAGNDNKNVFWESSGKNQLLAANSLADRYLITAVGAGSNGIFSTNKESDITVYNSKGKVLTEFVVSGTINNIFPGPKNSFALCTDNEVYIYDIHSNFLYKHGTISAVEKVCFINNKETIIFTKKDIHILTEEVSKNESNSD